MSKILRENDIRPDKFRKDQLESINKDIEFFVSKIDSFIEVECPACGCLNKNIEMAKNGFTYLECENCTMLYVSPRPTREILSEFYPNSAQYKFFNDYIFPASKETRRKNIFAPRVNKIIEICRKYGILTDKILEIGTGYGLFCEEMVESKAFKEVVGIEASDTLAKTCTNKGYRLYNGLLENLEINEKFNVAVSFEVIEHIFNPLEFVKIIYDLLYDNGVFMFSFPNYNGFEVGILREACGGVDHEHLNYFNEKSVSILLKKAGFSILSIETPGYLDVDIVKKALLSNSFKRNSFLYDLCVNKAETAGKEFQEFLQKHNLSSHMVVIAKKHK